MPEFRFFFANFAPAFYTRQILRITFLVITFLLVASWYTKAQTKTKKSFKDFLHIKVPAIQYAVPDTTTLHDEGAFERVNPKKIDYYFDPTRRERSLLTVADTQDVNPDDFSIVEVDEEINFDGSDADSTWIKIAEYYGMWDNKAVNPYGIDVTKFNDTVSIALYDSTIGRYCSAPLNHAKLNDDFGPRRWRWHYGIDLELDRGDSVWAIWDGIVRICKYDYGGYGNYVLVRHYNGLETIYGHLTRQLVKVGEVVKAGDLIGWGGSTGRSSGPHLHLEIRYQGHALDPQLLFDIKKNKIKMQHFIIMPYHFDYLRNFRKIYFHRIRRGDTLSEIAQRYNVSIRQILRLNRISIRSTLKPGRRIRIR
ncbi:MAG: M23 family metallopeptidase [Cytophagales bacterium]|nr:M23 family metallopeptidase [Cytophagales bacterium]